MIASRFVLGSLCTAAALIATATPADAFLAARNTVKPKHHVDSLHRAAHELKSAHGAIVVKNGGKANQHVSTAIGHLEQAIQHHKTNHLNQNRTGVTGAIAQAAHHHHHSQLHLALHAAKAAEKQIAAGNVAKAAHDVTRAHHHVELAIASHHKLIGK